MEDILASIKRIIADDSQAASAAVTRVEQATGGTDVRHTLHLVEDAVHTENAHEEEVLELTQPIDPIDAPVTAAIDAKSAFKSLRDSIRMGESAAQRTAERPVEAPISSTIISDQAASASRQSLAALSALVVKPEEGADNTLDGLVREMLRPMLKDWLDQRLPELVEKLVEKEIARITGRGL